MTSINQDEREGKTNQVREFEQVLGRHQIQAIAKRNGVEDQRRRKLPIEVFLWLIILGVGPGGELSLKAIGNKLHLARLAAGVEEKQASISKEALSEHFRECSWKIFKAVFDELWLRIGQGKQILIEEMRVMLVDATAIQVALCLMSRFAGNRTEKRPTWAGIKLHFRYELFTGLPDLVELTAQIRHEVTVNFLLPAGQPILYVFDLGYWKYELFGQILGRGQHFISRCKSIANPLILAVYQGDPTWVGKRFKTIACSGQMIDLLINLGSANLSNPQLAHPLRLVGTWNRSHQRWQFYVSSLLDPTSFSAQALCDLYRLRWQIEIFFRNLKQILHIDHFVSTTENGIRIQIYAALIFFLLTHLSIHEAARSSGYPISDFSFPYCAQFVHLYLLLTFPLWLSASDPDPQILITAISRTGLRPNRIPALPTCLSSGLS